MLGSISLAIFKFLKPVELAFPIILHIETTYVTRMKAKLLLAEAVNGEKSHPDPSMGFPQETRGHSHNTLRAGGQWRDHEGLLPV